MTLAQRETSVDLFRVPDLQNKQKNRRRGTMNRSGLGVECGLCLDEFQDSGDKVPRNLLCGHTFCTDCISKLMLYKTDSRPEIKCPKCHNITPVPGSNVSNLSKNFGLIEVISSVESSHHLDGEPSNISRMSHNDQDDQDMDHPLCKEHKDHISGYCLEDDCLVCSSCQLYGAHRGHKCLLVTEAAELQRTKLCKLNPRVNDQREKMQSSLQQVEDTLQKVEKNGGIVLDAVDAQFSLLTDALEKRRKELRLQVLERTQVRVHALMTQATDLRENIEKAASVYGQTATLLVSNNFTLLEGSSLALEKVEGVFTNPPSSLPSAGPDLTADFSQEVQSDITSHVDSFGVIRSVAGTVKTITVDAYHDGFRIFWDKHHLADNEGISYHLQGLVGEYQPEENNYMILYRGGNNKFTWRKELAKYGPYQFRVQVRTTEGVGNWSNPVTAFKAEPGFQWHESRRNVCIELSSDKLEASLSKGSQWATFAANKLIDCGELYVELNILDMGKSRQTKEKLVFGVIDCCPSTVNSITWQECKTYIGQYEGAKSFSYCPLAGTRNCHLFPNGKVYTTPVQLEVDDRIGMLINMYDGTVHFFHNGMDLGVAFDGVQSKWLLPAVSIREKVRVRLCFPPPPYSQRDPKIVRLSSFGIQSQQYRKRK